MSAFYNASVAEGDEIAPKYRRPLPQSRIIGVKAVSNGRFASETAIAAPLCIDDRRHETTKRRKRQASKVQSEPRNRGERVSECKKAFAAPRRKGFLFMHLSLRCFDAALQRATAFNGSTERHLIGKLKVAADGQAACKARDFNAERLDKARQIRRGRFALHIGIGGEHHLGHAFIRQARHKLRYVQVIGANAVHGGKSAAKHMVEARIRRRALNRRYVARLAHNAYRRGVTARRGAHLAHIAFRVIEAPRAKMHRVFHFDDCVGEAQRGVARGIEQPVRDTLSAFWAYARHALKLVEQLLDGRGRFHE